MKKIPWKTICLFLVLAMNVGAIISVSIMLNKKTTKGNYEIGEITEENKIESSSRYHTVLKGNLYQKQYFASSITAAENAYITYVLDVMGDFALFDDVEESSVLGQKDHTDVVSNVKGKIISLSLNEGVYTLIVFQYSQMRIALDFSYEDFYRYNVREDDFFFSYSDKDFKLNYDQIIVSSTTSSTITVLFSIENNTIYLNEGTIVSAYKIMSEYKNVYYLIDADFMDMSQTMTVRVMSGNTMTTMNIDCVKIIDNRYYIIEGSQLTRGLKIYE